MTSDNTEIMRQFSAEVTLLTDVTLLNSTELIEFWFSLSVLEYDASIWDPHLAKDYDLLEKLQRRSARFVKGDYRTTSSVSQMLHDLGWRDLKG